MNRSIFRIIPIFFLFIFIGSHSLYALTQEEMDTRKLMAKQGDAQAQYNLGEAYFKGQGVPQDSKEAVKWMKLAAKQGYLDAQFNLGQVYFEGLGVPQDSKEATKWWKLAAEQGDEQAQVNLAIVYGTGQGVPQDSDEAIKWMKLAANQGNTTAQKNLKIMEDAIEKERLEKERVAAKRTSLMAKQGNAKSQYNLGVMYQDGLGVPQDDKEAVKWYLLAAEQGFAEAQNNLGNMYAIGKGVPFDDEESIKWYRLAAEQGNTTAQENLKTLENTIKRVNASSLLLTEKEIEKIKNAPWTGKYPPDPSLGFIKNEGFIGYEKHVKILLPLTEKGDPKTLYLLSLAYLDGEGIEKNEKIAMEYLTKSANQNYPPAQVKLGKLIYMGFILVRKESEEIANVKASKWWHLAARQGHSDAQWWLGNIYKPGTKGVEANLKESMLWYKLSAEGGNTSAAKEYGFYLLGTGIEKDKAEGMKMMEKVITGSRRNPLESCHDIEEIDCSPILKLTKDLASKGNFKAIIGLSALYQHGTFVKKDLKQAAMVFSFLKEDGNHAPKEALMGELIFSIKTAYDKKDYKTAFDSYSELSKQGDKSSQFKLGNMYNQGQGTKVSKKDAIKWWQKSSEQGEGGASHNLGIAYANENNLVEAEKWYEIAVKQGYEEAKDELKNIKKIRQLEKKKKEKAVQKVKFNKWMELAEKYRSAAKKFCEKDKSPSKCISGSSCYAAAVIHEYSNDDRIKKFKKTLEGGLLSKGSMKKAMEEFQPMINDKIYSGALSKITFACYAKLQDR